MKLGNFYGLTAPNIIILRSQMEEEEFIDAVTLLNNPVDKSFIGQTKQELGFFRKALDNIPVTYTTDAKLNILVENPDIVIEHGVLNGISNSQVALEQIKRYVATQIGCYVCQSNRKNMLDTTLFQGKINVEDIRKLFRDIISTYLNENVIQLRELEQHVNKLSRKFLDRRGSTIMTAEKERISQMIIKAFSLKEEISRKFKAKDTEIILNEDEIKIIMWFKNHRDTLNECLPLLVEKVITSNQKVFSMPFRDLIFRKPERLISEVVHFYKSANVSTGREKIIKNILMNINEQVEIFEKLFEENVLQQGTVEEKTAFTVTMAPGDGKSLTILKRALKNYDLKIENCDDEKLNVIAKLFELTCKLTKEYYNELFDVKMSLDEWNSTIEKFNMLGLAGLNFYSTHLFIRSLKAYSFDDKIKIEKTQEEIEVYENVLKEVHAFLDSQLPLGTNIGGVE